MTGLRRTPRSYEVQVRGADAGGIAVHMAARVMAAAGPGEVLVSRTVHDLVAGSDYVLEDRGAHALWAWRVSGSCSRYAPEPILDSAGNSQAMAARLLST